MPKKKAPAELTNLVDVKFNKIKVFFKKSILHTILKILTMQHTGFRSPKSVKNINRLFSNIDMKSYSTSEELKSYIWCISYVSKQWLDGIVMIDLIFEAMKRSEEYSQLKEKIFKEAMEDPNIVSAPEAKMIFNLVSEALQYGFVTALRDEYLDLLEDIDLNKPNAFREVRDRLFKISKSLIDIQYNTNMISNELTFNTADTQSVEDAVSKTIESLSGSGSVLRTGIIRLNTLLSPGYMKERLYVYVGAPGSYKSGILLKTALDVRKYNPGYETPTPGMRPCVIYISMENGFTETIERVWNMSYDEPITNYNPEDATRMIFDKLGITSVQDDDNVVTPEEHSLIDALLNKKKEEPNIEVILKFIPYREISTDDLYTIINDLREENLETCMLILDYIKRIRPAETRQGDTVKTELARIINELKALATICHISVVTGHQINRAGVSIIDNAIRQGKHDVTKLSGREHIGDAYEILETADWMCILNKEIKPYTDDLYLVLNVVKRRRIDSSDLELAGYTYLAHPFAQTNKFRLIDDMGTNKVLSLRTLAVSDDMLMAATETKNAVPRLQIMPHSDFDDD